MLKETEDIVHMQLDFLPLKTAAHIREANALRIDWNDVVDKSKLSYIMGIIWSDVADKSKGVKVPVGPRIATLTPLPLSA